MSFLRCGHLARGVKGRGMAVSPVEYSRTEQNKVELAHTYLAEQNKVELAHTYLAEQNIKVKHTLKSVAYIII